MAKSQPKVVHETITITPPNFQTIALKLRGTAPLCINRFSEKAKAEIAAKHRAGSTGKKNTQKESKDFEALYNAARYISEEGWDGIHAGAFRNAAISACRTVGYTMTRAKLALYIVHDGLDAQDGTMLVRIHGAPMMWTTPVRNKTSIDLRPRPLYRDWGALLRVRFDADMFTASDVTNLFVRVGMQVGIGEGRPDSKMSAGIGLGTFEIE